MGARRRGYAKRVAFDRRGGTVKKRGEFFFEPLGRSPGHRQEEAVCPFSCPRSKRKVDGVNISHYLCARACCFLREQAWENYEHQPAASWAPVGAGFATHLSAQTGPGTPRPGSCGSEHIQQKHARDLTWLPAHLSSHLSCLSLCLPVFLPLFISVSLQGGGSKPFCLRQQPSLGSRLFALLVSSACGGASQHLAHGGCGGCTGGGLPPRGSDRCQKRQSCEARRSGRLLRADTTAQTLLQDHPRGERGGRDGRFAVC